MTFPQLRPEPKGLGYAMLLAVLFAGAHARAGQTLSQGIRNALNGICPVEVPRPPFGNLGPDLELFCELRTAFFVVDPNPGGAPGSATRESKGRTGVAQDVREHLEERRDADTGENAPSVATLYDDGRLGVFFNLEHEWFDKDITHYEPGFSSQSFAGMLGADYRLSDTLLVGAAGGIRRTDGDFSQGGGSFDVDSHELLLYGSYLPTDNLHIDLLLDYASRDYATNRHINFVDPDAWSAPNHYVNEFYDSETNGDEIEASVRAGYTLRVGEVSVVPAIGIDYRRLEVDAFSEPNRLDAQWTGLYGPALTLAYPTRTEESLTSTIGLSGTTAISYGWGVLVPQANIEWVHEFRRDAQEIRAHFVQDLNSVPTPVVYTTEAPDRDYFHVDLGVSAVLAQGVQPYFNFRAMLGHDYYDDYIVSLGVRTEL